MTAPEVLATLKRLGKPQTATIYQRYGTGKNVYGTLTSEFLKLQKKIKVDHVLAMDLWKSGNAEARAVALLIADPMKVTSADANRWIKDGPIGFVGPYLSALLARSPIGDKTMRAWMKSRDERTLQMGYTVYAVRLRDDADSISDADAANALATIEKAIHGAPNWGRYAMNTCLIAIGVAKPALRQKAIAAAQRIGKVEVDHGETHCKTPDAAPYIEKAAKRGRAT